MANTFESQDYIDGLVATGNLPVNAIEGTSGPAMEMPSYVSHKKVWALEISSIEHNADGSSFLRFSEKGYAPLKVLLGSTLFARYKPVAGDFYVVYSDGYKSLSPRKAFLEGYTRET